MAANSRDTRWDSTCLHHYNAHQMLTSTMYPPTLFVPTDRRTMADLEDANQKLKMRASRAEMQAAELSDRVQDLESVLSRNTEEAEDREAELMRDARELKKEMMAKVSGRVKRKGMTPLCLYGCYRRQRVLFSLCSYASWCHRLKICLPTDFSGVCFPS